MKGLETPEIKKIFSDRRRIVDRIEVLNHELDSKNKLLGEELVRSFGKKFFVFMQPEDVIYFDGGGKQHKGLPGDTVFQITEIRFANSFDDIIFLFTEDTVRKREYFINHRDVKDFEIFSA